MLSYLLRRLLFAAFLVFAVSSASLVVTRLAPGDYATGALGLGTSQETREQMRARLGLDRPLAAQYWDWLGRAARLDFGRSLVYDRPVVDLIPERAANTALLALSALFLATIVGLPLGVLTGTYRGGALRGTVRAVSVLLLSMPPLLTSLLLVFLAARTGWFPIGGMREGEIARTGQLQRIVFNENWDEVRRESLLRDLHQRIRDVRQGPDGLIYVLTEEDQAALLRLEPVEVPGK